MTQHTPAPWTVYTPEYSGVIEIQAGEKSVIAWPGFDSAYYKTVKANAARIVECVNACEGLNPAAIREVVEALETMMVAGTISRSKLRSFTAGYAIKDGDRALIGIRALEDATSKAESALTHIRAK